jgi:ABC-type branched-subunit amino acid transport system substrate-binding protein
LNAHGGLVGERRIGYSYRLAEVECDRFQAGAALTKMLDEGPVDVVIGPDCSLACESTADITAVRSIPQISYSCSSAALSDKSRFPTVRFLFSGPCPVACMQSPVCAVCAWQFVRTTSSYASWAPAIVGFATWAKWTQLATVLSTNNVFSAFATRLALDMQRDGIRVAVEVQYQAGAFDAGELGRVAAFRVRVVVVIADSLDVVTLALAAKDRGMHEAGYAWLGLDTVAGAEAFVADGLKSAEVAKAALHGWIYFAPSAAAPAAFFDRVRVETRTRFPMQPGSDDVVSTQFAANMYDAVTLYGMATRNASWLSNGAQTVQAMQNLSFDGMTGRVELDENGDMRESIGAMNYVLESEGSMRGRQIGVYDGPSRFYSPLQNRTVVWPGDVRTMPVDSAIAVAAQAFNTSWLLVGACAAALVLMPGLVFLIRRRHAHLQAILVMLLTEMGMLVFSFCMAIANLVTDGIVFDSLLRGDLKVSSEIYMATYATLLCFGVVATALSMGYRIRNARLVRTQLQQLAPQGEALTAGEAHREAQRRHWELAQTHRTKVTLSLSLLSVAVQGARARAGLVRGKG